MPLSGAVGSHVGVPRHRAAAGTGGEFPTIPFGEFVFTPPQSALPGQAKVRGKLALAPLALGLED
jgi:hypothetical protein